MNDQEIAAVKFKLNNIITNQIEIMKGKLKVLRSYQDKIDFAKNQNELDSIAKDFAIMFKLSEDYFFDKKNKENLTGFLNSNINLQKDHIQLLRTMVSQTAAASNINDLKIVHDKFAQFMGIPDPSQKFEKVEALN